MFQTLILIASIVVLAGAILTSSLVSAKNAFHQIVAAKTQTAMTDATSQFTAWAQTIIATKGGTEQDWAGAVNPSIPTKSMCANAGPCQFYETTTWVITGATTGTAPKSTTGQSVSTVQNMAPAVDEQRLSATISVAISDQSGHAIYGGRTEHITARLFDADPYIVITGIKDLDSDEGRISSVEGDTGGIEQVTNVANFGRPAESNPSAYTNTTIRTTIDCLNDSTFDESNPMSNFDKGDDNLIAIRQGGSIAWSFQMPCTPTYGVPNAPASASNYIPPLGSVYQIGASNSKQPWEKGDQSNGFPQ